MKVTRTAPILAAVLLALFTGSLVPEAFAKDTRLTLATMAVPGEAVPLAAERFAARVKAAAGNKIQIIYNDSLLSGPELAPGVRDGRVEMAVATYPYLTSAEPRFGVTNLPGLIANGDDYKKLLAGFLQEEYRALWLKQANAVPLVEGLWTPVMLFTTSPIATVADFKGKKIRVSNLETGQFVTKLGASPVPIPANETMTALERGVIDGYITSVCYSYEQGFFRVTRYMNDWGISPATGWTIVINKDIWDGLTPEVRNIMTQAGKEVQQEMWDEFETLSKRCFAKAREAKVETIRASAAERAKAFAAPNVDGVYQDWYKRAAAKGFDGEAFVKKARATLGKK